MTCFRQDEVKVGYHGKRLTRAVPGSYVARPGGPLVYVNLPAGTRFAVTSTRNGIGSTTPAMLRAVNGWRWGYPIVRRAGKLLPGSGCWVPDDAIGEDQKGGAWAKGPARLDFAVGYGKPRKKKRGSNGKPKTGEYKVRSRNAYIRFAPHSTAVGYLLTGDRVSARRKWGFYTCVQVVSSSSSAVREGWVLTMALKRL